MSIIQKLKADRFWGHNYGSFTREQQETCSADGNYSRLGLAIVPLCHGTGAPFDEHRRPLAPSKFFDRQHYR